MNVKPEQVEAHGCLVWADREMDALRRERCLCLRCGRKGGCDTARELFNTCRADDVALAVTRCPCWIEYVEKDG